MASANNLRKGNVFLYNKVPHLVLDAQHRTPGNLRAFVQVTMRNLQTGASSTQRLSSTETVEIQTTDRRTLEYSYIDPMGYHFLDPETFEDIVLDEKLIEDAKEFLEEGGKVDVLFVDGNPISVDLPASVELEVTEAPEMIKGDTSGAALKPVTCVTGLIVRTPLFIKTGDRIKINTADKSYQGRV